MQLKRIIPCLDVKGGKVVKGKSFKRLAYAGDALSLAKKYYREGADELVFLDIAASAQGRGTIKRLTRAVAQEIFIPFTVGGGIRTPSDAGEILQNGADKISINTAAVENPALISKIARKFGSQAVVVAIDAKRSQNSWTVFTYGGRKDTGIDAISWAKKAASLGAGEILLTSMDKDGSNSGYDVGLNAAVSRAVNIPVIASGGAGSARDIAKVLKSGADAALLAGILHRKETTVEKLKKGLKSLKIAVR
ncbi:Imidazole glycerol phosphate synthase subunit HisF [Candidatus Anstonella stagnisolia]|nr:Imidazole glycerol phosphate synthase subunit HisF [Candidatus Anstonella stagnisolia]